MTPDLRRVLVACRGPLARRLIRAYRARGIETVAAFADADAEAPYVTEADYDAYLGEGPADRAWRDTGRLIAAAMDAGCDGIHAGTGPSASALGLHAAAAAANVTVIGPEPNRVADTLDRVRLFARARAVELPVPPIEVVGPGEEWIEVGARIGVPLIAFAALGGVSRRVDGFDALGAAVEAVRDTGDGRLVLMRAVGTERSLEVVVVGDRAGVVPLGAVAVDDGVSTHPAGPSPAIDALIAPSVRLATELGLVGVGVVRFGLAPDGSPWFLGFEPHLPPAVELVERVQGVDLVDAEHRAILRQELGWADADAAVPGRVGVAVTVRATGPGVVTRLDAPPDAPRAIEVGTEVGPEFDPRLIELAAVGPDLPAARAALVLALDRVRIEGVPTDRDDLRNRLRD